MWNGTNFGNGYWTSDFGQSGDGGSIPIDVTPGFYSLTTALDLYEIPVGWIDVYNLSSILDVFEAVLMSIALYTINFLTLDVFESVVGAPDYYSLSLGTVDTFTAEIT
jgi:hypothetical protein